MHYNCILFLCINKILGGVIMNGISKYLKKSSIMYRIMSTCKSISSNGLDVNNIKELLRVLLDIKESTIDDSIVSADVLETTKYVSSVLGVISHDNDTTLEDVIYQFSLINSGHILEPISSICDKLKELEIKTSLGKKITVRD